jgi:hypothetical protein
VLGALGPEQLARTLRTAFDPYARTELAAVEAADPERAGLSEVNAWPLGTHEAWDQYRADGAVHATYWIAAWPRIEVSPMFMDALLGHSSAVRTVAVTFESLAIAPRARWRPRSRVIAPTASCGLGSVSPRPRASARPPTPPCAAKPSSPPATPRCA